MKKLLLILMVLVVGISVIFLINEFSGGVTGNVVLDVFEDYEEYGFVSRVIDGDTVVINGESVRLLSIDTDEKGYDCFNEAKLRMEDLVLNKEVRMEKENRDKDIYDRYLRHLFIDGEHINFIMVEEGLAIARFYEDNKYKKEFLDAEVSAREDRIGCKWRDL